MEAIIEDVSIKGSSLKISIPKGFPKGAASIIIVHKGASSPPHAKKSRSKARLAKMFEDANWPLPKGYKFDRDELHDRKVLR
jgi:hypothetical protein